MDHVEDLPSGTQVGYWYYGETGTGKTYAAKEEFPNAYIKNANTKWWDGYKNQENVIMDDFDKAHNYMGYHLKIWADRYAFHAEVKGGAQVIRPQKIVVTSNYHPKDIWEDATTIEPILRRFKVVHFVTIQRSLGLQAQDEERVQHIGAM